MSKGMNRPVSTLVGLAVIVIVAGIIALTVLALKEPETQAPPVQKVEKSAAPVAKEKSKYQSCLDSGGAIEKAMCCGQTQDFPNNCAIGACGCAPANSHEIKTCNCGAGKCFDGNACKGK